MQPVANIALTPAGGTLAEQTPGSPRDFVELTFTKGPVQFTKRANNDHIEIRGQDGSYAEVDKAHWRAVKAARVAQGLPVDTRRGVSSLAWW